MIKETLIKELEELGVCEIELENEEQITILKRKKVYFVFLEKWNKEWKDWEILESPPLFKNIEEVFKYINSRFNIEVE